MARTITKGKPVSCLREHHSLFRLPILQLCTELDPWKGLGILERGEVKMKSVVCISKDQQEGQEKAGSQADGSHSRARNVPGL